MIKKSFWKEFTEERIVVNCKNYRQAHEFTEQFVKNVNCNDREMKLDEFEIYGADTCICSYKSDNIWNYSHAKYYVDKGFTLFDYDDIIDNEPLDNGFKIVALIGCSASGKDSIQAKLVEDGFKPVVSHTSRPMRKGEIHGREYYFVDTDTVNEMLSNGEFIEHRVYHVASGKDWVYGISKQSIDCAYMYGYKSVVIVDFQGLKELERYLESIGLRDRLTSIYVNALPQTRLIRSLNREGEMTSEQVEEVIRRYNDDKQNVEPAILYCDIAIKNETEEQMDRAIKIIKAIIGD